MKKIFLLILGGVLALACGGMAFAAPAVTATPSLPPTSTWTPTLTFTPTFTDTPLPTPTETATITQTFTITPTFTDTPIPSPTLVRFGPGNMVVPIFMYHHVAVSDTNSRYYTPPDKFDEEMRLLHDWGYTTITTEMLVKAINEGADLPAHPIIISFDDGNINNYTTAFPIMQKYGFTGVLYIVGRYMDAPAFMTADQIKEMANAGWEVGSHGMRHYDLTTLTPEDMRYEIVESKKFLEKKLGVPVNTIAYPFGTSNNAVIDYARFAGYIAGMSVGVTNDQGPGYLFVLQRMDIKGTYDVKTFASYLPWQGDPIYLPTDTPTPSVTPSRTPMPTITPYPTKTSAP